MTDSQLPDDCFPLHEGVPLPPPGDAGGPEVRGEAEDRGADSGTRRAPSPSPSDELANPLPRRRLTRTRRRVLPEETNHRASFGPRERMLILDAWHRTKLPAKDFSSLVGVSTCSLYKWKQRFDEEGPAGLEDKPKGRRLGSRLSEECKRAILMMKEAHQDWGQDRIHAMLMRTQGFGASASAIGRFLVEEGYVTEEVPTKPHPDKVRRFERSKPNELWQTDLFTFVLKRQNRRVHLVGYMDDYSRFLVGYGLHASSSGALVREVMEAAIANHGAPLEVLTDNGTQYKTWRGKSAFTKLLERRGIKQIVASPRHPQTLGKIERFWGTLWRECVQASVFRDLEDARERVGQFIDYYNFQRPHSGIDGMVPADRFFEAAPQVLTTLRARVDANAKELAVHGKPRKSFYLTGRVGDSNLSLHAEGDKVLLTKPDGSREEVDLKALGRRMEPSDDEALPPAVAPEGRPEDHPAVADDAVPGPGESPLDDVLRDLSEGLSEEGD